MRPDAGVSSAAGAPATVGCEGMIPDHQWIQDERKIKRQKQKNSNRESARRSRLRKQVIAERLLDEEIAGLKEIFKMNSGHITFEELKNGLKRFGANLEESDIHYLMQSVSVVNAT